MQQERFDNERQRALAVLVMQVVAALATASVDGNSVGLDDLIGDVLTITILHRERIRVGSEVAWIRAVARRSIANRQRAARRQEALLHQLRSTAPPTVVEPLDATGDGDDLIRLLERMTEFDRVAIALLADGHSIPEIAEALDVSDTAARQRITRARKRLRHAYLENCTAPAPPNSWSDAAAPLTTAFQATVAPTR